MRHKKGKEVLPSSRQQSPQVVDVGRIRQVEVPKDPLLDATTRVSLEGFGNVLSQDTSGAGGHFAVAFSGGHVAIWKMDGEITASTAGVIVTRRAAVSVL